MQITFDWYIHGSQWVAAGSVSGYHGLAWGVRVAIKDWDGECEWLSRIGMECEWLPRTEMGSVTGYRGLGWRV